MQATPERMTGIAIPAATTTWPPPADAAVLYAGKVMHARLKPVVHRFTYSVFSLLIDLDRLDEANRMSGLFSVNRANLVSFREADHFDGEASSLRAYADDLLAEAGLGEPAARILLACYPRVLGYVFNPLSVFYAYAEDNRLLAMIYDVHNTFGERHSYVFLVEDDAVSPAGIRQACDKVFHVSPFIPMAMRYRFRMLPPGDTMRWRILETDAEGPLLSATYSATRRPLTSASIAGLMARMPGLTWKIIAGIHFEALRLWMKGVRYIPHPAPPPTVSFETGSRAKTQGMQHESLTDGQKT